MEYRFVTVEHWPGERTRFPISSKFSAEHSDTLRLLIPSGGTMHSATQHVLRFFECSHLPPKLQVVALPFADLAQRVATAADNPETTVALRKLLEAKDAAVRAVL
jgi:NAD(P)H-dependent FMN reductase